MPKDLRLRNVAADVEAGMYVPVVKASKTYMVPAEKFGGTSAANRAITFAFDGGGSELTAGSVQYVFVPYACTIVSATVDGQGATGSIVLDIWVDSYANFPPTVLDTITAAAKPTITAATKSRDTTLTGWTTAVAAGSYIGVKIDSVSSFTKVRLTLEVSA